MESPCDPRLSLSAWFRSAEIDALPRLIQSPSRFPSGLVGCGEPPGNRARPPPTPRPRACLGDSQTEIICVLCGRSSRALGLSDWSCGAVSFRGTPSAPAGPYVHRGALRLSCQGSALVAWEDVRTGEGIPFSKGKHALLPWGPRAADTSTFPSTSFRRAGASEKAQCAISELSHHVIHMSPVGWSSARVTSCHFVYSREFSASSYAFKECFIA